MEGGRWAVVWGGGGGGGDSGGFSRMALPRNRTGLSPVVSGCFGFSICAMCMCMCVCVFVKLPCHRRTNVLQLLRVGALRACVE